MSVKDWFNSESVRFTKGVRAGKCNLVALVAVLRLLFWILVNQALRVTASVKMSQRLKKEKKKTFRGKKTPKNRD